MGFTVEKRDFTTRVYSKEPDSVLAEILGQRYKDYRKTWARAGSDFVPDIPLHLNIELADICNQKCKYCYRSASQGSKDALSLEAFNRVIGECADIAVPGIGFCFGEPLLVRDIDRYIQNAAEKGFIDIIVTTNGTMLDERLSERFIEIGFSKLHVSLDAATPEAYKKIRGTSLEKVENNIKRFLDLRTSKNAILPLVRVSFVLVEDNRDEVEMFIEKWKDKVDYIDIQQYVPEQDAGSLRSLDVDDIWCDLPFRQITVRANGDIQACCSFFGKHLVLGNVHKGDKIVDAWRGKKLDKLRRSFLDKNYYLCCKNCKSSV